MSVTATDNAEFIRSYYAEMRATSSSKMSLIGL